MLAKGILLVAAIVVLALLVRELRSVVVQFPVLASVSVVVDEAQRERLAHREQSPADGSRGPPGDLRE